LNWNAIIDILHRALELNQQAKRFEIRTLDGLMHYITPITFADDLRNHTKNAEELQEQANIICAFCGVFGIRLNTDKTKMFINNYGNEQDTTNTTNIIL